VQLHSARQSSKQIDGDVPSNTDAITIPDHARLRELGAHDQRRLVRRLELFLTSHTLPQPPRVLPLAECSHLPFDYRCFFLSPPRIWAARRTDYRVEQMIDRGLLNEVAQLMSQQLLTANSPAATSIGYRGTIDYLNKVHFD
jgi:tRNA dimethylallyltransferase